MGQIPSPNGLLAHARGLTLFNFSTYKFHGLSAYAGLIHLSI